MTNEVLRIKNDVLNELRNQKYYLQDELKFIVDAVDMTQKEKVNTIISIVGSISAVDNKIVLVENIFIDNTPTSRMSMEEPQTQSSDDLPDNIVESSDLPDNKKDITLNQQGQTHEE